MARQWTLSGAWTRQSRSGMLRRLGTFLLELLERWGEQQLVVDENGDVVAILPMTM
jgi:hypothetical protein